MSNSKILVQPAANGITLRVLPEQFGLRVWNPNRIQNLFQEDFKDLKSIFISGLKAGDVVEVFCGREVVFCHKVKQTMLSHRAGVVVTPTKKDKEVRV